MRRSILLIIIGSVLFVLPETIFLRALYALNFLSRETLHLLSDLITAAIIMLIVVGVIIDIKYLKTKTVSGEKRTGKTTLHYWALFGIAIAFTPIATATLAFNLGKILNCSLEGGFYEACMIGGKAMTDIVNTGLMFHWVSLGTFFPGIGIAGISIILLIFKSLKSR